MSQVLVHRQRIVRYLTAKIRRQRWIAWGLGLSSLAFLVYAVSTIPSPSPYTAFQPREPQYVALAAALYAVIAFFYIVYVWLVMLLRKACKRPKLGLKMLARGFMATMAGMILPTDETNFLINYWAKRKAGELGEEWVEPVKEVEWAVPIDDYGMIVDPDPPAKEKFSDPKSREIVESLGYAAARANALVNAQHLEQTQPQRGSFWGRLLLGPITLFSVSWTATVGGVAVLLISAEVGGAELAAFAWLACGWYGYSKLSKK